MTAGEAYMAMMDMAVPDLIAIASRPGFGPEEETARSVLRARYSVRG